MHGDGSCGDFSGDGSCGVRYGGGGRGRGFAVRFVCWHAHVKGHCGDKVGEARACVFPIGHGQLGRLP